jgi:hypothetical protein
MRWSEMYRDVLLDLSTSKSNTEATAISPSFTKKQLRNAQIEILSVYAG